MAIDVLVAICRETQMQILGTEHPLMVIILFFIYIILFYVASLQTTFIVVV